MILRYARWKSPSPKTLLTTKTLRSFSKISDPHISELNQEMESIFGGSPAAPPSAHVSSGGGPIAPALTHVTPGGDAQMVDVSGKKETKRSAVATCKVLLGKEVFELVSANKMAKGDVFTVAKIAGIGGAKKTADLIPLCHNIRLSHVDVDFKLSEEDFSVRVAAEAAAEGKTGVEMEAMTAAAVAALTVYDMCKAASKEIQITDVRLERKAGGKSGDWSRKDP